jgi:small subunit ribosomal protein S6
MWIIGADADEAVGKASIETISSLVTQQSGEMIDVEPWGRRTLSFPIKRNKEGSYFLAHFKMLQTQAPAFEKALNANQDIIRYLLVIPDGRTPKKAEARRPRPASADAGTPAAAS